MVEVFPDQYFELFRLLVELLAQHVQVSLGRVRVRRFVAVLLQLVLLGLLERFWRKGDKLRVVDGGLLGVLLVRVLPVDLRKVFLLRVSLVVAVRARGLLQGEIFDGDPVGFFDLVLRDVFEDGLAFEVRGFLDARALLVWKIVLDQAVVGDALGIYLVDHLNEVVELLLLFASLEITPVPGLLARHSFFLQLLLELGVPVF